jgi:hypothetical protein
MLLFPSLHVAAKIYAQVYSLMKQPSKPALQSYVYKLKLIVILRHSVGNNVGTQTNCITYECPAAF